MELLSLLTDRSNPEEPWPWCLTYAPFAVLAYGLYFCYQAVKAFIDGDRFAGGVWLMTAALLTVPIGLSLAVLWALWRYARSSDIWPSTKRVLVALERAEPWLTGSRVEVPEWTTWPRFRRRWHLVRAVDSARRRVGQRTWWKAQCGDAAALAVLFDYATAVLDRRPEAAMPQWPANPDLTLAEYHVEMLRGALERIGEALEQARCRPPVPELERIG